MRRPARVVVLVLVLLLGLSWSLSPAYAADDVITNLDVRYEVRSDGTVGSPLVIPAPISAPVNS